jgi:hypothetical protein
VKYIKERGRDVRERERDELLGERERERDMRWSSLLGVYGKGSYERKKRALDRGPLIGIRL